MPLNDDPEAITDDEYEQLSAELRAAAEAEGAAPCPAAVDPYVLSRALTRLDANNHG